MTPMASSTTTRTPGPGVLVILEEHTVLHAQRLELLAHAWRVERGADLVAEEAACSVGRTWLSASSRMPMSTRRQPPGAPRAPTSIKMRCWWWYVEKVNIKIDKFNHGGQIELRNERCISMADWKDLTQMTGGAPMLIERVRLPETQVAIEGAFELPPLAQLPFEDQVFVAAFVRSHGSIKEMERLFGVSYPTIKNRLNRISAVLEPSLAVETSPAPSRREVLDQ